jgi:hypothetical protein
MSAVNMPQMSASINRSTAVAAAVAAVHGETNQTPTRSVAMDHAELQAKLREIAATATAQEVAEVDALTAPTDVPTTRRVRLTPAMAALIVTRHNGVNRDIRAQRYDHIKAIIEGGEYMFTHQGVAVGVDGGLLDGQHRMIACALSGIAIDINITVGLPRAVIDVIDQSDKRTSAQALEIAGITDSKMKVSVAMKSLRYMDTVSGVKAVRSNLQIKRYCVDRDTTLERALEIARESVKPEGVPASFEPCLSVADAGSVAFLMLTGGWPDSVVREFLCKVQIGQDQGEHSPVVAVAEIMLRAKRRQSGGVAGDSKIGTVLKGAAMWATNTRSPRFRAVNAKKDRVAFTAPAGISGGAE